MWLDLKKGDKVRYLKDIPYKLANGQEVFKEGEEMFINSEVSVQKDFFEQLKAEEPKVEKKEVKEEVKEEKPKTTKTAKKTK